jgi:hypothetical protein
LPCVRFSWSATHPVIRGSTFLHGPMVYLDIAVIRKYLPDDRFNGTGQGVGTAKRFGRARQGRRVVIVDKLDLPIDANGTEDTPGDRIEKGFGQFPIIH